MRALPFAQKLAQLLAAENEAGPAEICALLAAEADANVLWALADGGDFHVLRPHSQISQPSPSCAVWALQAPPGKLTLYREGPAFDAETAEALAAVCLPSLALWQRFQAQREATAHARQRTEVRTALNALTYTELAVVVQVFRALEAAGAPTEGILVAGKIADGLGITRSVVVTALRKLESAQVIETRALGAKGTHIKVLNACWLEELRKLGSV